MRKYVEFRGHMRTYNILRSSIVGFEALHNQAVNCNLILESGASVYINGLYAHECQAIVTKFDEENREPHIS